MGLSIHYDGQLKNDVELSDLIAEVTEFCETNEWPYNTFIDSLPKDDEGKLQFKSDVFGIGFNPPDCETVFICFETDGKLGNPLWKMLEDDSHADDPNFQTTSVKTGSAGFETHKKIINLFRLLSEKYFSEFKMYDEANYWDTNDEKELRSHFEPSDEDLKRLAERLGTGDRLAGETNEEYYERIMESYKNRKSNVPHG